MMEIYLSTDEWLHDLNCQKRAAANGGCKEWAGGRESALPNTHARVSTHGGSGWKFFLYTVDTLPVSSRCLWVEATGFICIIRQALLLQPGLEANTLAWPGSAWRGSAATRNRPPDKRSTIWPPVCFCYSVLGPHSFEDNFFFFFFFLLYLQWVTALFSPQQAPLSPSTVFFFFLKPVCSLIHFFFLVITCLCLRHADWHLCHAELILGSLQPLHAVIGFVSLNETLKPLNPTCGPSGILT